MSATGRAAENAPPPPPWGFDFKAGRAGGGTPVLGDAEPQMDTGDCRPLDYRGLAAAAAPTGQSAWMAMRILNHIDERILEDLETRGACGENIHIARENIARLLRWQSSWRRPDAINADAVSDIHIVWRSAYGKVEIDADPMGRTEYYVIRTVGGAVEEGAFKTYGEEEMDEVMGWLEPQWRRPGGQEG